MTTKSFAETCVKSHSDISTKSANCGSWDCSEPASVARDQLICQPDMPCARYVPFRTPTPYGTNVITWGGKAWRSLLITSWNVLLTSNPKTCTNLSCSWAWLYYVSKVSLCVLQLLSWSFLFGFLLVRNRLKGPVSFDKKKGSAEVVPIRLLSSVGFLIP